MTETIAASAVEEEDPDDDERYKPAAEAYLHRPRRPQRPRDCTGGAKRHKLKRKGDPARV